MKRLSFFNQLISTLFSFSLLIVTCQQGVAQSTLFSELPGGTSTLSTLQLGRFNEISGLNQYSELKVIQFNSLATTEQSGDIPINVSNSACGQVVFKAKNVDYHSENDYSWYGEMNPKESCDCKTGRLLLTKSSGELFGELQIGDENYVVEDLGGGKQTLGKVSNGQVDYCGGAVSNLQADLPNDIDEGRSGISCNIRVLVLGTESAMANAVNNFNGAVNNAINFMNQSLINSQISSVHANFVLAGIESTANYFDETGKTTLQCLNEIRATGGQATIRRNAVGADIVVLCLDPDILTPDDFAGWGETPGRWVALDIKGPSASKLFAHEIGHNLGATHEPCATNDPSGGCIPAPVSGFNHAHTFLTGCDNNKKRKTIMYGALQVDEIIPHYSNPAVNFDGKPTGVVGVRNNALTIKNSGCTAATYSTLFDDAFHVAISGPAWGCPNATLSFSADVSGNGVGNLTYEWRKAIGGTNYGPVFSTAASVSVQMPSTLNQLVSLKLKVTNGLNGETITRTKGVIVQHYASCGSISPDPGPEKDPSKAVYLSAFPNPSSTDITFELLATKNLGKGVLSIQDAYGKVIRTFDIESIDEGKSYFHQDLEGLPTGLYSYSLVADGKRETGKFNVFK